MRASGDCFKLLTIVKTFPEPIVREIARQVLNGLSHLHGQNIVHRDIKSANILLYDEGVVRICDFGLAKHLPQDGFERLSYRGTLLYAAPELIVERPYDFAVSPSFLIFIMLAQTIRHILSETSLLLA